MKPICETCRNKSCCGYIKRGRESDCLDVQTYDSGYEQAVEAAKKAYCKICTMPLKDRCKVQKWCVGYNEFAKQLESKDEQTKRI